jgi:ketosteroid isomerase-like protein
MSERDVELLRQAYQAFNRRDLGALLDFFDPDAYWVPAPSAWRNGYAYHGPEGVRQLLTDLAADWDEFSAEPEEFREIDDLIFVSGRVHAVTKGGGEKIDSPTAWVWEMRNGKAIRLQAYTDPQKAREALGVGRFAEAD